MAENGILDYQGMNQAIYRGATSNIVVDTQSMSIEIGAGNTSHTSNLHFECNHDANVASIKLNSNVTTEFSRSKKLIKYPRVALTGSTSGGYTAQTSSINVSTQDAWYAFDNIEPDDNTSRWRTASSRYTNSGATPPSEYLFTGSEAGDWISIELPEKMRLVYYTMTGIHTHTPQEGVIYGYDSDTSTWHKVSTFYFDTTSYPVNNTPLFSPEFHVGEGVGMYSKYAMIVTKTNGSDAPSLYEWKLFGLPEYDPDAAGLDVTVKSVPNVPNTDWLEVYYDAKDLTSISGTIADLSGKSVTGSLNGDVSIDTLNDVKSFSFDGSGDYIRGQLTSFGGEQTFTFSLWFNMLEFVSGSNNSIFQIGSQGASEEGLGFRVQSGSVFRMYTWGGPSSFNTGTVHPNTWYHAVGTYAGGVMTLYVDGNILQSTSGSSLNLPTNPYFALGVQLTSTGAEYSTSGFKGSIANFRLFNRALTSDEVWQLYSYQKEYFGHGDLSMTLKAGRLGIGTSEPRAALDVKGEIRAIGSMLYLLDTPIQNEWYWSGSTSSTGAEIKVTYSQLPENCRAVYADVFLPQASADDHGSHTLGRDHKSLGNLWTAGRSSTSANQPTVYMGDGLSQGSNVVFISQPGQNDNEYYFGNWWPSLTIPLAHGNILYHGRDGIGSGTSGWILVYVKGYYV